MKRTYAKPQIVFESFSMSTNIAGNCHFVTSSPTEGTPCGFKPDDRWTGEKIFLDSTLGCGATPPSEYDSVCYDVPTEDFDLFNS